MLKPNTTLSLIAAIGNHSEIGKNNQLLWHLPADFTHFKKTTMGKPIIMGRKTFESLPGALPGRLNIVLSRQNLDMKGAVVVNSIDQALQLAQKEHHEIMIIGGATLYNKTIEMAHRLYITHVNFSDPQADAFFPTIHPELWQVKSSTQYPADENNPYDFSIKIYDRK